MYNWNAQMRGTGFPMHPQQMMQYQGMQQSFQPGMPYQGPMQPQNWGPQQPPNYQGMGAPAMGMMMGQTWMPQAPGMYPTGYADPMAMAGVMGGMNPMPPMQPPPEEKPPLPAEPPPPLPNEKPPPPQEQAKPPLPAQSKSKWDQTTKSTDLNSQYKPGVASNQPQGPMMPGIATNQTPGPMMPGIANNQPPNQMMPGVAGSQVQGPMLQNMNAASLAPQPAPPHLPPTNQSQTATEPAIGRPQTKPPPDPALVAELDRINQERQLFLDQYKQWKKQYDDWREQNQNHPNKEQFQQYLEQWQTYEQQMELRRSTIDSQKQAVLEKLSLTSYGVTVMADSVDPVKKTAEGVKASRWDSAKKETPPSNQAFGRPNSARDDPSLTRTNLSENKGGPPSTVSEKKFDSKEQSVFQGKPNLREQVSSPSGQVKIPGIGDDDKGEEDMNLDEDENGVGGIIESRQQAAEKMWMSGGQPESSADTSGLPSYQLDANNSNNWNTWNQAPGGPDQGQWGNQGSSFGPQGPDFQAGPRMGNNFYGGPNFPGGPRQGPDFQGGPRPDFHGGPRLGPDYHGGPRMGADFHGGPRMGAGFQSGPRMMGPNFQGGPKMGPDFQGGPRIGPDFQQETVPDFQDGPRAGTDFQGGPRPGPDVQGGPRPGSDFQGGPRSGPDFQDGPRPGPDFQGGPRPGPDFQGGPRQGFPNQARFQGRDNFRGRGRGDWNNMRGNGPRFGRPGMNEGPRFPGPPNNETEFPEEETFNQGPGEENNPDFEHDNSYLDNPFFNGPVPDRGRGQRGRGGRGGEFQRGGMGPDFPMGRGSDFQSGRGGDMGRGRGELPMGRGSDSQRGTRGGGSDFMLGRGGEFQRGRGEEFQRGRGGEFQRGRGGQFQRGPDDMFSDGPDSNFFDAEEGPGRGGFQFRGRGRGQAPLLRSQPPSLLDVNFDDCMRERFPDFDPSCADPEEESFRREQFMDDPGFQDNNFLEEGIRPMGRGRGRGFSEPSEFENFEEGAPQRGRGMLRGRGLLDRGRGLLRPRGGLNNEPSFEDISYGARGRGRGMPGFDEFPDRPVELDEPEDAFPESFANRGRGRGAGRGMRGRGGFGDLQEFEDFGEGPPIEGPFRGRGRGGVPFGRGRGRGMGAGPWSNDPDMEPHLLGHLGPEDGRDSLGPLRGKELPLGPFEGEPDLKKPRFDLELPIDTDRRGKKPYPPHARDPFDPYRDPFADPYHRFPDPYFRDPYLDAHYGFDRLAFDRYGPLPPDRKPFIPAESIDYGHGGLNKEKKSIIPAEVIDYGHGQASDTKSSAPQSVLERERAGLFAAGSKDGDSVDMHRDRNMGKGVGDWPASRDYRDADYRDDYGDRGSRDMDLRSREHAAPSGFGYGSEREEGRFRSRLLADEDMRFGRRGEPDYPERLADEREDHFGRVRFGARGDDRRIHDYDSRGDALSSSKMDERISFPRGEDSYGPRRDDYLRLHDEDIRGGRGLPHRDSFARDPYSRDERDPYRGESTFGRIPSPAPGTPPTSASLTEPETVKIEDILCPPGRLTRPPQIVVIIRGLPGSGKTYISKLIREKETNYGGSAARMLCLDDYFMVESDKEVIDPDTGKKVKKKVMEYEYEQALEEAYRQSLLKSFKKTVDDGFFPFIILDATNERVAHFSEFWSYAKSRGFQVYVGELKVDVATCIQRNVHNWTEWDIEKVKNNWEQLPCHYIRLDLHWLLQEESIPEVVMEESAAGAKEVQEKKEGQEEEEEETPSDGIYVKSKWELDTSEETLDKLDGIRVSKKHILEHQSLNEYLQLDQMDDEYNTRESLPGKKRVRWADLEEKKVQNRRRNLGFIVGQTQQDWDRITDDDFANKALNQTKYFYKS
uniref:YLP motif-containing protein 1 n=1 Tax=Biomphalaria glabrata TaxID=6526 RepID=A0A2C9K7P1_BIOGL